MGQILGREAPEMRASLGSKKTESKSRCSECKVALAGRVGPARLRLFGKNGLHGLFLGAKNEAVSAPKWSLQIAALEGKPGQKEVSTSVPPRLHTSHVHPRHASCRRQMQRERFEAD